MTAPRPSQPNGWVPYAGFLLAVAGVVYQGGLLSGDVQRNTDRINRLEAVDQARSDAINSINVRTARIEAKLDYYMPARRRQ